MPDEVRRDRDRFDAIGSEDSLLSHEELTARVVSSILHDSDLRKVDALFVEEALALLLQGTASVCPSAFVDLFLYCFSSVSKLFLVFWQVATYAKGLARRASLAEGSAKAEKSYKAKVASLTSERADLRAHIRDLTEELVKHCSYMKHALTARVLAEDKEKKARKDVKVAKDELRLTREELQAVKGDLCAKVTTLDLVRQKALKVGNSMERLMEELGRLRMDLERQKALVS